MRAFFFLETDRFSLFTFAAAKREGDNSTRVWRIILIQRIARKKRV